MSGCANDSLSRFVVGNDQEDQIIDREIKQENFQIVTVFKGKHSLQESYAHPIKISPETILSVMEKIRFQTREYPEFIKAKKTEWSLPAPLFSKADLPAIASGISQIFGKLSVKEEVYFYIDAKHRIEGKTYITTDGWYWYFRTIDGNRPKNDQLSNIREWKINLQQGENYIISRTSYELKRVNVNWVSMPLPKEVRAAIQQRYQSGSEKNENNYKLKKEYSVESPKQEAFQPTQQRQNTHVLDKKILILNKLKDDGIITEEEYQIKIQKILKKEL